MTTTKHQFRARIKNVNYDYLEDYQIVNDYSNIGEALNAISNELNRIRLGTNNTDRNTQILIELVQGHMQMQNLKHIITTDMIKPPFLTDVEKLVQESITNMKQRKDSKKL